MRWSVSIEAPKVNYLNLKIPSIYVIWTLTSVFFISVSINAWVVQLSVYSSPVNTPQTLFDLSTKGGGGIHVSRSTKIWRFEQAAFLTQSTQSCRCSQSNDSASGKGSLAEKPPDCPPLEGDMDKLTQEQFMTKLTDGCRYDKLIKPYTEVPLNISVQMDLRHIEAIEQLQFRTHMLVSAVVD